MTSSIPIPAAVTHFFARFPLHTYDAVPLPARAGANKSGATLWIAPPKPSTTTDLLPKNVLSQDVECLKWQAYVALRGLKDIGVRWDVSPDGAVDQRLPTLQTDASGEPGTVVGARKIPGWVDNALGRTEDEYEGYLDASLRDESRAWVSLLEGIVHVALSLAKPDSYDLKSILFYSPHHVSTSTSSGKSSPALSTHLTPPAAPSTGLTALFPPSGQRVSMPAIRSQYRDAIVSLADRLGQDEWFLGSSQPTPLDALAFAYLHCLLDGPDNVRLDVVRRVNLVNWERRVREIVQVTFHAV